MNTRNRARASRRWTRYGDPGERNGPDERDDPNERNGPGERDGPEDPTDRRRGVHGRESARFTRTVALSNGVFGISLTLLVLSLSIPGGTAGGDLGRALSALLPNAVAFGLTVFVVALYWRNHNELFESFAGIDGTLFGLNVGYLALVALVPFPNELIGTFQGEPLAYAVFGTVLAALAVVDTSMFVYARRRGILRSEVTERCYRIDVARGVLTAVVFVVSVPLSLLLAAWTPLLWVSLLLVDVALDRASK